MTEKKELQGKYKTISVSIETHNLLVKLSKRYGKKQGEFISLLLENVEYYGLVDTEVNPHLTKFDKLRKSVKSFNDSAWSAMAEQRKDFQAMMNEITQKTSSILEAENHTAEVRSAQISAIAELLAQPSQERKLVSDTLNALKAEIKQYREEMAQFRAEQAKQGQALDEIKNKKRSLF